MLPEPPKPPAALTGAGFCCLQRYFLPLSATVVGRPSASTEARAPVEHERQAQLARGRPEAGDEGGERQTGVFVAAVPASRPRSTRPLRQSVKRISFSLQTSKASTSLLLPPSEVAATETVQPFVFGSLTAARPFGASGFESVALARACPQPRTGSPAFCKPSRK